jgi:MFS family permease
MKSEMEPAQAANLTQRRRLPLFTLYGANTISMIGDELMFLAIPWFVLQTTGSVAKTGITAFFTTLPTILSAFFGSAVVDRLGYKRASVISDLASGIGVALIPLFYRVVGLAFWQLLVLVFLSGLLVAPGTTARYSMVPDLAELAGMRLERANAASSSIHRIAVFLGAPLAGVLILLTGSSNLLWLDAASFFLSAILIGLLTPATPSIATAQNVKQYLADLRAGLRFIRRDTFLLALVLTLMITNMLDNAYATVLAPAYIKQVFDSPVLLGALFSAFGGCALLGTITFGIIGHRLPRRLAFALGFTLVGVRFWVLALLHLPFALVVLYGIIGLAAAPLNPLIQTVEYERVPTEMRARVFGAIWAGEWIGIPLGVMLSGYLSAWIGLQACLLLWGICYILTTLSVLVNPGFRGMEQKAQARPQ